MTSRRSPIVRHALGLAVALAALIGSPSGSQAREWNEVLAEARGQTVYFNAWAGDPQTNAFIAWVGEEAEERFGVEVEHVKLTDTAEAVARVLAEKSAGRDQGGSVDLVWINGANFLAMRQQDLLFGPFAQDLPNWRYVDTTNKPSNVIDFTVPTEGYESPWHMAQIVYVYDSARIAAYDLPRSMPAMLEWVKENPGRLTHPTVRDFLGATFLKQALYELAPDPAVLQEPATDATFAATVEPLWAWYDALRPHLWRGGREFPANGPAQRQLMSDGEIELYAAFNPAEAAVAIRLGTLPRTARVYVPDGGTIGNTSFVAIPYNAAHKEAAMVVADFLLSPEVQARAQDPEQLGNFTVLDLAKLDPAQQALFERPADAVAVPTNQEMGSMLLEPHPSWMTRIVEAWEQRYLP
ncbi:ABC transporter substrate-binding protein [Geminicoccus roseus]|uniref:ABC transporter substrate-binding protein n=1 Tax=Geminicoccus roseus TaxID=404900 RepID=UPI0004162618|nr:ABC transporter substrate-binding protein [Geminicoccus roseus]